MTEKKTSITRSLNNKSSLLETSYVCVCCFVVVVVDVDVKVGEEKGEKKRRRRRRKAVDEKESKSSTVSFHVDQLVTQKRKRRDAKDRLRDRTMNGQYIVQEKSV